jgi:hypothetical protein
MNKATLSLGMEVPIACRKSKVCVASSRVGETMNACVVCEDKSRLARMPIPKARCEF